MPDLLLDAGMFAPAGPDVLPFGVCSDSAAAIAALRDLADGMERGLIVIKEAQVGRTAAEGEYLTQRVFLEYQIKPW